MGDDHKEPEPVSFAFFNAEFNHTSSSGDYNIHIRPIDGNFLFGVQFKEGEIYDIINTIENELYQMGEHVKLKYLNDLNFTKDELTSNYALELLLPTGHIHQLVINFLNEKDAGQFLAELKNFVKAG